MENDDKQTLLAFLECYDLYGPAWPAIERGMRDSYGIDEPEEALEKARDALMN